MTKKIKISTVLYTSYKTSDEKYNLKIRISFNGYQKNISTKFYFTKDEFKEIKGKSNTRIFSKDKKDIIKAEIFEEIQKYQRIIEGLKIITPEALNKELNKEEEKYQLELIYLLNKEDKQRRANGKISSANQYKETAISIKKIMGIKEIAMVDVTPAFLQEYEKNGLDHGYSPTTISIYMRSIKYIWNYCINNDLLNRQLYPFGRKPKYTIIKSRQRKSALDTIDMIIFKSVKLEGAQQFYLDLFLFSYYTFGMNLIDILKLEHNDIYNGFIDTTRTKTDNTLKIPLTKEAEEFIEKYKDKESKFLFGKLDGNETHQQLKDRSKYYSKKINKVLKAICDDKKIAKKVTFYTARHTSANNLLVQKIDVATISQLLGHKDIKTTQNYLSGLPDYDIKERVLKIAM